MGDHHAAIYVQCGRIAILTRTIEQYREGIGLFRRAGPTGVDWSNFSFYVAMATKKFSEQC